MKIETNIREVLKRVEGLKAGVPLVLRGIVLDLQHWRARAKAIAHSTLTALAGDKADLVPMFVQRVVVDGSEAEVGSELSLSISNPVLENPQAPGSSKNQGQFELPLYLAETFRAAFLSSPSLAYDAILQWVSSGEKDKTHADLKADGTMKSDAEIADVIYNIIFKGQRGDSWGRASAADHLLMTDEEAGHPHFGGKQRLIEFFAAHPLTRGLSRAGVEALAAEWLATVLLAWRAFIPEEIVEKLKEGVMAL